MNASKRRISKEDDENVVSTYELLSDEYKENTVSFGMDPFGNYICFRYNTKNDECSVILLNHEDNNEIFISKDFLSFLNKLY